jgi:hypothetical protein
MPQLVSVVHFEFLLVDRVLELNSIHASAWSGNYSDIVYKPELGNMQCGTTGSSTPGMASGTELYLIIEWA